MPEEADYVDAERFEHQGISVVIGRIENRTEIVIDGEPHEVKFLDNGRPWTQAYVNVMATSVRDLAERWVDFKVAQERHWAEVDEHRRADKNEEYDRDGGHEGNETERGGR